MKWIYPSGLTWRRWLLRLTLWYIAICIGGCMFADKMIFLPPEASYSDSDNIIKIPVTVDQSISAIYIHNKNAEFTILYSHGNAEDLGHSLYVLQRFSQHGYSVLGYDYRGYGTSDGKPSEKNSYADELAAYKWLVNEKKVPPENIIVYGRSVGGGMAADLAMRQKVGALVLDSSFVTAFRVMTKLPLLPVDKFRNISKIDKINCPVLVIHSKDDNVIPYWHGRKLFDKAKEPKICLWAEGIGHNNDLVGAVGDKYWQALEDLAELLKQ